MAIEKIITQYVRNPEDFVFFLNKLKLPGVASYLDQDGSGPAIGVISVAADTSISLVPCTQHVMPFSMQLVLDPGEFDELVGQLIEEIGAQNSIRKKDGMDCHTWHGPEQMLLTICTRRK